MLFVDENAMALLRRIGSSGVKIAMMRNRGDDDAKQNIDTTGLVIRV